MVGSLGSSMMPLDPKRTVAELRELQELTGNADGAQRVAWTDTWVQAQDWMAGKLDGIAMEFDEARNQWWTVPGASDRTLVIGGHLDSVPNGGWLDGALNVVAGSEVLRRIAAEGEPPVTVRPVSWADEEGARFGRSLFGSSAAAGSMRDQDELRQLTDADGVLLPDAIGAHGIDLDRATEATRQLDAAQLAEMLSNAEAASRRFAQEENIEVEWERIWNIEPILFDEQLIELADESIRDVAGTSHRLPSGPLHDAAEISRAGIPTVMVFVQSLRGLSHTRLEDTKPEHLGLAVQALDRVT